jgi:hypothetical protein
LLSDYDVQPSRTPPLEGGSCSDNQEISDVGDDDDLPSIKKILASAKSLQPQKWTPESVIDLNYESDDNDDNTAVSPHRKRAGGLESHKANAAPSMGSFYLVNPFYAAPPGLFEEIPLEEAPSCSSLPKSPPKSI